MVATLIYALDHYLEKPVVIRTLGTGTGGNDPDVVKDLFGAWSRKHRIFIEFDFDKACA